MNLNPFSYLKKEGGKKMSEKKLKDVETLRGTDLDTVIECYSGKDSIKVVNTPLEDCEEIISKAVSDYDKALKDIDYGPEVFKNIKVQIEKLPGWHSTFEKLKSVLTLGEWGILNGRLPVPFDCRLEKKKMVEQVDQVEDKLKEEKINYEKQKYNLKSVLKEIERASKKK